MVLASLLFVMSAVMNGAYPGGADWIDHPGSGWIAWVFALLNVAVALLIGLGSERGLLTRVILAAVFLVCLVWLLLLQPTSATLVIYAVTALIEVVILVDSIRVWRLGRAMDSRDLDAVFALDAPIGVPSADPSPLAGAEGDGPTTAVLSARLTWSIGLLSLALATVLVLDGVVSGFIPGGSTWGLYGKESGWLVYIFAMVALVVAVRAVHGSALSLRLLLVTALIVFLERPFSPLVLGDAGPLGLVLRLVAAALALATAVTCAMALRASEHARRSTTRLDPVHATSAE